LRGSWFNFAVTPMVRLWIWVSAFASLAGWGLSAVGQLNRAGYAVAFAIFAIFIFVFRKGLGFEPGVKGARVSPPAAQEMRTGCQRFQRPSRHHPLRLGQPRSAKLLRRFRRPLPLGFAALAGLVFLGGAIYPPTHYNAMTYHIPRVLQWLAAGRWHWIHTAVTRMNYSGCDFEWLSAPLLLFTKSDRALFLLNFIPFLLLPGLVFSVFTRLGVRARAAWHWMWLFPTGYIFLLQAGSAGNDAFATVYALAAIDSGCRAWKSHRVGRVTPCAPAAARGLPALPDLPDSAVNGVTALPDLFHSVLAVALLTGTKPTSLPLLLPWAILMVTSGAWRVAGKRNFLSLVTCHLPLVAMAAVISFLPIAVMNKINCGDWLGTSVESSQLEMHNPLTGIAGNIVQLGLHNFVPPLFPLAGWWNRQGVLMLPHSWTAAFQPGFCAAGELPDEDWAGIGFGLSALLAVSVVAAFWSRAGSPLPSASNESRRARSDAPYLAGNKFRLLVLVAPWIALLFFCAESAMNTPARLIAPYYPLLAPLLLAGAGQSQIVRRGWWRALAGGVVFLALVVLALSPDRPLWPARTVLSRLAARHPDSHLISRALNVYTVYANRSDPLADVRALLPPGVRTVGFIGTADDSDISLWRPFGSRRVEDFLLSDPPERFRREQVEYAVVGGLNLQSHGVTLDDWLQKSGAELVASTNATEKVSEGPQEWFVVRFK
jgi:hypothetical protein